MGHPDPKSRKVFFRNNLFEEDVIVLVTDMPFII